MPEPAALLPRLRQRFPALHFTAGDTFCWSPETQEIFYQKSLASPRGAWSLLHETGHALLDHTSYERDIELLNLEVAAWDKARQLAQEFSIAIDEEHVQNCLDTYRDWLHARSICPTCTTQCFQQADARHYRCHNCHTTWKVSPARFARSYRAVTASSQPAVVFADRLPIILSES